MEKSTGKILIIDDDKDVLFTANLILKQEFARVVTDTNPENIPAYLKSEDFDVLILDMNFKPGVTDGQEGLYWLNKITETDSSVCIIAHTAYGDIKIAVEAMKQGASEFIAKPWESEKFLATVQTVMNLSKAKKQVNRLAYTQKFLGGELDKDYTEIITKSKLMHSVLSVVDKVAQTDAHVLILGENGTGKELVAREIHRRSLRAGKPFINVDLGAVSGSLFESELFGHAKGAFTDAKEDKPGRFEIASGGTLFLDEIGNLPLNLQSKLLSVIQNHSLTRIGSVKTIDINIRLICATNRDLYQLVSNGEFRQDLLYRINTVEINLPPLRKRKEDIELLTGRFLEKFSYKYNKQGLKISKNAYKVLNEYDWPGNIRELQHLTERAVIMADKKEITADDFAIKKRESSFVPDSLKVEELEKQAIINAIEKSDFNYTKAAKELGLGRSTLYRKMKKYGI